MSSVYEDRTFLYRQLGDAERALAEAKNQAEAAELHAGYMRERRVSAAQKVGAIKAKIERLDQ